MVCLECGKRFTFDFCDKPACIGSTVPTRDDITTPHLPTHDFLKIRSGILHYREIGKVFRAAKAGLTRANALLDKAANNATSSQEEEGEDGSDDGPPGDAAEQAEAPQETATPPAEASTSQHRHGEDVSDAQSEGDAPVLTCIACSTVVSRPCWYCIDCPGTFLMLDPTAIPSSLIVSHAFPEDANTFVCAECDEKEGGISKGDHHLKTHSLVRCIDKGEGKADGEEAGDSKTEARLTALARQMTSRTNQTQRIETLLRALREKNGQESPPVPS